MTIQTIKPDSAFSNNRYTRCYLSIITASNSKSRQKLPKSHKNYEYFESHHILPKSLGGSNSKENLVLLTAKEHFICHLLLTKMCRDDESERKMIYAYAMMSVSNGHHKRNKSRSYVLTRKRKSELGHSEETKEKMRIQASTEEGFNRRSRAQLGLKVSEEGRKRMSEAAKQRPPKTLEQRQAMGQRRLGCKHSEETKLKIGQSHKGLYKPPHTEETKQRISEKLKGRKREPFSDEHKEKISIAARNRGPEYREKLSRINKGKTLSEETRRKISESNKGQKRSEEFKQKLRGRVVSEETRQRIRDQNLNRPKQQYKVVFPNGDEQIVDNRQDFCVKHNLNYAMFGTRMSKGRDYNGLMIYKIPK